MLAPEVRSQFAQRLKNLRTQRGFDRARYFAKSLGIEENRYTRYERAEVEPNLTLIHKMCETLRVSPNELLGFGDLRYPHASVQIPGFAEPLQEQNSHAPGSDAGSKGADPVSSLAWGLASEAVAIRHEHGGKARSANDPLAILRETSALCSSLKSEPFDTVAAILNDAGLKDVDARHKAKLAELIQAFTDKVSEPPPRRAR